MRIGFGLPNMGSMATPEAIVSAAERAEALGYDSVWVIERVLYPVNPQSPYPPSPDGKMPEMFKRVFDPLDTLSFVAARTRRIALGTSVLDMPFYNPVMLARRLTTIDVLSGGRLKVGLGLGWSKDEFETTGAPMTQRGAWADEFIQVIKTIWTNNPAEFQGKFFRVPKSFFDLRPVQKPHPPIYLAAFAPAALNRVGRLADGWNPVLLPVEAMTQMFAGIKEAAKAAGRDPSSLQLIVRGNIAVTEEPIANNRGPFSGSLEQIRQDIDACRRIGAHELIFDPLNAPDRTSLDAFLRRMEQMRDLVG